MPTGTVKTTVFSEIVRKAQIKGKTVLIVVHRIELVEQIVERLFNFGVNAGIISSGKRPDNSLAVQVATIQTLFRRDPPAADIVIIDECHHAKAQTYRTLWNIYPQARFLGETATPERYWLSIIYRSGTVVTVLEPTEKFLNVQHYPAWFLNVLAHFSDGNCTPVIRSCEWGFLNLNLNLNMGSITFCRHPQSQPRGKSKRATCPNALFNKFVNRNYLIRYY